MWGDFSTKIRKCTYEKCDYEVRHDKADGGYCSKPKHSHWNEPILDYNTPKCECGAEKTRKIYPNASYFHARYCPAFRPY